MILDKTLDGEYHGHVRTITEILNEKNGDKIFDKLFKHGLIDKKGNPLL